MHLYIFFKAKAAFGFGFTASSICLVFLLLMIFAPVLVRLTEGMRTVPNIIAWAGYTWMGVLFLFLSISLPLDAYKLLVYGAGVLLSRDFSMLMLSSRSIFMIPFLLSMLISVYGYFEANNIILERVRIETEKLPGQISRLRIVQISDVHLGLIVRYKRLKSILDIVKEADADILVSTGDLVDAQMNHFDGIVELLQEIKPRYGKFAVTGNHEFYAGIDQALDFTEKAGFHILRGEVVNIKGLINIAGLDDPAGQHYNGSVGKTGKEMLAGVSKSVFTLLLKHRPLPEEQGLFDLQLSGHTHNGQIFPFNLITGLEYPVNKGLYEIAEGSYMYVSRGSGTWGPPIRFFSPPEVTVIDLVRPGKNGF